jgi:hypothetical protein
LIILAGPLIAGIYGILHDQITYTICPEYYTKFKFYQFGLSDSGTEAIFPNPRLQVSLVGLLATWWMGIPIGIILGVTLIIYRESVELFSSALNAYLITLIVAFLTGLVGLIYGKLILAEKGVSWWLPENLVDKENFIAVGSMHNFSYLGGLLGLLSGIIYVVKTRDKKCESITNAGNEEV